jgi:hypothetical protein
MEMKRENECKVPYIFCTVVIKMDEKISVKAFAKFMLNKSEFFSLCILQTACTLLSLFSPSPLCKMQIEPRCQPLGILVGLDECV